MGNVQRIVRLNGIINECIKAKDYKKTEEYMLKLHKLELKDKVSIGSYRIYGV